MPPTPPHRRHVVMGLAFAAAGGALPALAKPAGRTHHAPTLRAPPPGLAGDMVLGAPGAPVTVVEYASLGCPVCGRWHKEVYPAFKAKWIDTGKVRFVFREMLVGDQGEITVAAAGFTLARAAGPAKYFQVVDAVFDQQPALFNDPDGTLSRIAAGVGVPHDRFEAMIRDPAGFKALAARVDANIKADDVNSTPTFVIGGTKLEPGYQPLDKLDAAIAKAHAA